MIMTPEKMPAPPTPAIARPMIKAIEFGAAPQITEPISNRATVHKKVLACGENSKQPRIQILRTGAANKG